MALTPSRIIEAAGRHGQMFVHGPARLERACLIARDGIRPGSEIELPRAWSGNQTSRDGFVYIGSGEYVSGHVPTAQPLFCLDLTDLDAERLSCDEDHVTLYTTVTRDEQHAIADLLPQHFHVRGDLVTWRRGSGFPQPPRPRSRLNQGQWANQPGVADMLASDEFVAASLALGAVCYEGTIAPSLLRFDDGWWRSEISRIHCAFSRYSRDGAARSPHELISIASAIGLLEREAPATEREHFIHTLAHVNGVGGVLAGKLIYHAATVGGALDGCDEIERALLAEAKAAA